LLNETGFGHPILERVSDKEAEIFRTSSPICQLLSSQADSTHGDAAVVFTEGDTIMTTHELKCWPQFFQPIYDDKKRFEFRVDDRNFVEGDCLKLREFTPCPICHGKRNPCRMCAPCRRCNGVGGTYTGREANVIVTYILRGPHAGVPHSYCCMSIAPLGDFTDEELKAMGL
jgi:hypothetical protein